MTYLLKSDTGCMQHPACCLMQSWVSGMAAWCVLLSRVDD